MSSIFANTITSLLFMKNFMNTTRSKRRMQQYTIVNWVMGGRFYGLGNISTYPITINSFSMITRGIVAVLLRPKSMSDIINTYINPLVAITTTYISPLVTIISTHTTHIIAMTTISQSLIFINIFVNRTRRQL